MKDLPPITKRALGGSQICGADTCIQQLYFVAERMAELERVAEELYKAALDEHRVYPGASESCALCQALDRFRKLQKGE